MRQWLDATVAGGVPKEGLLEAASEKLQGWTRPLARTVQYPSMTLAVMSFLALAGVAAAATAI